MHSKCRKSRSTHKSNFPQILSKLSITVFRYGARQAAVGRATVVSLSSLQIIDNLLAQSQSADVGNTTALPQYRAQVETALRKVDVLCQSAAYMNQIAGTTSNGLVNPPTPEAKGKAGEIAVAAAQYKIEVTRTNLTASRDAYMQVSQERQRQQSEITQTILQMTRVDLENVTLKGMRHYL